jgi:hypothetical protein
LLQVILGLPRRRPAGAVCKGSFEEIVMYSAQFAAATTETLSIPDNPSLSMGSSARITVCAWVQLTNSGRMSSVQNLVSKRGLSDVEYLLRYDCGPCRFAYIKIVPKGRIQPDILMHR